MTSEMHSHDGCGPSNTPELYNWETCAFKSMNPDDVNRLLSTQLGLKTEDNMPFGSYETIQFGDAEDWKDWLGRIQDKVMAAVNPITLNFESTGDNIPLFLLAMHAIVRGNILNRGVCVLVEPHQLGIPGTNCSLRGHLRCFLASTEHINLHEITRSYQTNLKDLFSM